MKVGEGGRMTGQINEHKQRNGVGAYGIKRTEHKTSENRQTNKG